MKNILILLLSFIMVFLGYSSSDKTSQDISDISDIKALIIGKWVLSNDKKFIVEIQNDSIAYYYNGKIKDKNPIQFTFGDSLSYYKIKNHAFDFFKDGELASQAKITEYNVSEQDTIIHVIVYIDQNGMDIISGNRTGSFNKLKNK